MVAGTGEHGPLPRLLIGLTVVTGLVDAFSYVTLGHVFVANMTGNVVLVLAGAILVTAAGSEQPVIRLVLIALLAAAMGGQNAVVRRLGVPDLTTTVLTLTVTGLVADASPTAVRARRTLALLAMLIGALIGGVLLRWVAASAPLWLATALLLTCAALAYGSGRSPGSAAWR
jgi:uncharacterized membrane protein YoaK (UPF0700 family)